MVAFLKANASIAAGNRAWPWTILFGLAWGCSLANKLTGWFLPIPLVAWVILYRDWRAAKLFVQAGLLAFLVLYALLPTWWLDPIQGLREFLGSNLARHEPAP
ncbi:hypothetical protein BH23PLA1_BH23PLA1_13460 [soil metagenome]